MPESRKIPSSIKMVFVPVIQGLDPDDAISFAKQVSVELVLVGLVPVASDGNVSAKATSASELRTRLDFLAQLHNGTVYQRVIVAHNPWAEMCQLILQEKPDLLCVSWKNTTEGICAGVSEILIRPPCNLAMVSGKISSRPGRILVPQRGGPHAEVSLLLALNIPSEHVQVLHVEGVSAQSDLPFQGLRRILPQLHGVITRLIRGPAPLDQILSEAQNADIVIMGASAQPSVTPLAIGPVAAGVLSKSPCPVVLVRTVAGSPPDIFQDEIAGVKAISVLVDRWFAENTYVADEFQDIDKLLALKQRSGLSISLVLPALNEEQTIAGVIAELKPLSQGSNPLLDEILLIDSNSTDRTREIAREHGLRVHIHQQILPHLGAHRGKGEALWKSLMVARGDIIVWLDTDVKNMHPRFVYGLIGPLLSNPDILFVKGFYRRPIEQGLEMLSEGGGRVTELTARPLFNLFYPELSGIIQPLSGEYAGYRKLFEQLPFFSGYGVETGLLIDAFEKAGLHSIAQVNLIERVHRNQSLQDLSKMSFAIIQVVMSRLERRVGKEFLEEINKSMKLIRNSDEGYRLEVAEIIEHERPAMIHIPEYQTRIKI